MRAHTPGPWATQDHVSKVSNFGGWQGRIHAGPIGIGKVFGGDKGAVLANARLVAAAPDLLASLECALNQLDALERAYEVNSDGHLSGSGLPPPSRTEAYRNARAAIAKAGGELPSQGNAS